MTRFSETCSHNRRARYRTRIPNYSRENAGGPMKITVAAGLPDRSEFYRVVIQQLHGDAPPYARCAGFTQGIPMTTSIDFCTSRCWSGRCRSPRRWRCVAEAKARRRRMTRLSDYWLRGTRTRGDLAYVVGRSKGTLSSLLFSSSGQGGTRRCVSTRRRLTEFSNICVKNCLTAESGRATVQCIVDDA